MKAESFLPTILLAHDRDKPWMNWIPGAVLFADVSGFTPMSEALSVLGAEGGEILTDVLNRYFAEMIGIVHGNGGQVMKFGGDAILCFFPDAAKQETRNKKREVEGGSQNSKLETRNLEAESLPRALRAASLMQDAMPRFQNIKTPVKRFALKMKIGVAHGDCLLAGVGDEKVRCDYVFAGTPVDATSDAEHHAVAGEIVFGGDKCKLQIANCKMEEVEPGFYRILDAPAELENRNSKLQTVTQAKACGYISPTNSPATSYELRAADSYLIREIHAMVTEGFGNQVGALLDIVPVFLRFKGFEYAPEKFDLARFHAFFTLVMEITHRYGGRLNRINMGDKGSTFFILFGAPNVLEKKEELACQWALDLQQEVREKFPEVVLGVGMNAGRVFAGIVGGSGRSEYTVMGDAVNFAARLMQGAEEQQVCASQSFADPARSIFAFQELGKRKFKGKAEPLPVFSLLGRGGVRREQERSERLVGRSKDLKMLLDRLKEAADGKPGMGIIEGEPGTGKSFLAAHVLDEAESRGWEILKGHGEITRRNHPYAPWTEVLAQALFQGGPATVADLERSLDEESRPYLQWHAELFGLSVPEARNAPTHDEETRKRLFQHQLSRLLLNVAAPTSAGTRAPIEEQRNLKDASTKMAQRGTQNAERGTGSLIFLDDLHWFDTLSIELLGALLNHLTHQPVFILAATRPNWERKNFQDRGDCIFCPLAELDREGISELATAVLEGKARDALITAVLEKTRGNPFFARQYLLFLKQENMLESRLGEWLMKRGLEEKANLSASDILAAQVSRLSPQEQVLLKFAACIGPTLSLSILRRAMGPRYRKKALDGLIASGYLCPQDDSSPLSQTSTPEIRTYSFPHALIQEALYNSIPQRERRRAHRRIAQAMEELLQGSLESYYPNLANHFSNAGVRRKTIDYSTKAGEHLFKALSFPESCAYYEKSFRMLRFLPDGEKHRAGLLYAEALLRVGQFEMCKRIAERVRSRAKRLLCNDVIVNAIIIKINAMQLMSDYTYIPQAKRLLLQTDKLSSASIRRVQYFLSWAFYRTGKAETALSLLNNILLDERIQDDIGLKAHMVAADIEKTKTNFNQAIQYIVDGLERAYRWKNIYHEIRLKAELANINIDRNNLPEAYLILSEVLERIEKIGDYYLLANVFYSIGKLNLQRMELDVAERYLRQSIELCVNLGIINGQANGLLNLGIVEFYQKDYSSSYAYYLDAVHIFERIGEVGDICHGCYDLAEVCMVLNRNNEAIHWHAKGMKMMKKIENPSLLQQYLVLGEQLKKARKALI